MLNTVNEISDSMSISNHGTILVRLALFPNAREGVYDYKGRKVGVWEEEESYELAQGMYEDGKRVGEWTWREGANAVIVKTGRYEAGLRHGLWQMWDYDGTLLEQGSYVNDQKTGKWRQWQKGSLYSEITYVDGVKTGRGKERILETLMSGRYVNGRMSGVWKAWHNNGVPKAVERYDEVGLPTGTSKLWYYNGRIKALYCYKNGHVIYSKLWYDNGQLQKFTALEGSYPAYMKTYHRNGQLKSRGRFSYRGHRMSWQEWDENGVSLPFEGSDDTESSYDD